MKSMIENYINGNIRDAQKQAKRYSYAKIREGFMELAGYSFKKATLTAEFLKTGEGFQQACDIEI